jgi:hypothetical protein
LGQERVDPHSQRGGRQRVQPAEVSDVLAGGQPVVKTLVVE